jgi:hypothetical protein
MDNRDVISRKQVVARRREYQRRFLLPSRLPTNLSHQPLTNQRGFKGFKMGAASPGRTLSAAERKAVEDRMRAEGKL